MIITGKYPKECVPTTHNEVAIEYKKSIFWGTIVKVEDIDGGYRNLTLNVPHPPDILKNMIPYHEKTSVSVGYIGVTYE